MCITHTHILVFFRQGPPRAAPSSMAGGRGEPTGFLEPKWLNTGEREREESTSQIVLVPYTLSLHILINRISHCREPKASMFCVIWAP